MANVESIVKTYRTLSQIPSILSGRIWNNKKIVTSVWTQRNVEKGKASKFLKTALLNDDNKKLCDLLPIEISNELLVAVSPSEKYRAVIRDYENKQFLEVWQENNLINSVDLKTLDLHGSVYTDSEFSSLEWSSDEQHLLYIAEAKTAKNEPFYKRKGTKPQEEESKKGEEHLYEQDWGEQLVDKKKSVIVQYDLQKDDVKILEGIPDNICPAKVKYSPDSSYLVGVAYKTDPRKLGLIYCTNRPSTIFKLDFNGNYLALQLENKSVKTPFFSPDGKTLLWFQRTTGGPHASCLALVKINLPIIENSSPTIVVNIVRQSINGFPGLYNFGISQRCFASDNRLILTTIKKNALSTFIIDINNGTISELVYDEGSQIVLDVWDDWILVNRRNFLRQDQLAIAQLPSKGNENQIIWIELSEKVQPKSLVDCFFEYLDLTQNVATDSVKDFSAIYLSPKPNPEKSGRLIVWPHGGPHSAFINCLMLEAVNFLTNGYSLLLINYRGSLGAGQDSVEFLPGKIGRSDVDDCILATKTCLERHTWLNPEKIALIGGSHGGFLVTHLSGQYPDMFKAVVARNPVIDVASMSIISDIPDWCYVEAGREYTQIGPIDDDLLLAMRKASPIKHAHKVKAPTLLQIGSKDLRVPCHQGMEYLHRLKANGVIAKMNLYDDNHPLGSVPNEMDNIINTILWVEKYIN